MDSSLLHHSTCGRGAGGEGLPDIFSPLEIMMVVTLIPRLRGGQVLIIASIATPIYRSVVVRAREAVMRDDLYPSADGRFLIDRFRADPSADGPLARAPRRDRGEGVSVSRRTAHRPLHRLE